MKIDEIYRNLTLVQNASGSQNVLNSRTEASQARDVDKSTGQDTKVEISDISVTLNNVKEALNKDEPERVAKVQALKEAIVQGKYEVSSDSIADKILRDSLPSLVED